MPFPSNVTISGAGNTPQFSWKLPNGINVDAIRINIRDTSQFNSSGSAVNIFSKTLAGNATTFQVDPTNFLQPPILNREYSIEISLLDLRNNPNDFSNANILSRSQAWFNFQLLSAGAPPNVYLPSVAGSATAPVYHFQVSDIEPGQIIFIDPLVAIGYEYRIGVGDPNFVSFLLPTEIGDNVFSLFLWNGSHWYEVASDLIGGAEFFFANGGVDRFQIRGIELSAALDPSDVTAFVTGLSFAIPSGQLGTFSGTMVPIISTLAENLAGARAALEGLLPADVGNPAQKNMMIYMLNLVSTYQAGPYRSLASTILKSLLARVDGCALRGSPDTVSQGASGVDFVKSCSAQAPIYPPLKAAAVQLMAP